VAGVLVDHRVGDAVKQRAAGVDGELVADPDEAVGASARPEGRVDAAVAGADAVDRRQLALALQELGDQRLRLGRIVMAFGRREQLQARKLAGHDLLEAEQTLGMVAQGVAAEHDADPRIARADEAAEQARRGPSRGDVVDADVMGPARGRHVGYQRDDDRARSDQIVDRRPHLRVVERHHHHRVVPAVEPGKASRHDVGREAGDVFDVRRGALLGKPVAEVGDLAGEHRDEAVAPARQHEADRAVPRPGQPRRRRIGSIVEAADDRGHALGGPRLHPGATVQHPVDGRRADPGLARDIGQANLGDDACGLGHQPISLMRNEVRQSFRINRRRGFPEAGEASGEAA